MKYQHVHRTFSSPFYLHFKKHDCPDCHELLRKVKVSRIVNSDSPEAEEFEFGTQDTYMVGNVRFIWTELECPACKRRIKIEEMKKIEKAQR